MRLSERTPMAKTTKKTPAKKSASAKSDTAQSASTPMIDTNLAAASAAQQLLARRTLPVSSEASTGSIKQLKQDVAKPHKALDSLFQSTAPKTAGHSHLPHQRQNSSTRAQTKGADVSRVSVPRRTAG